jgi:hypothetical protein
MGALLEKMDHQELNRLDFIHFKFNVAKYCWKELE